MKYDIVNKFAGAYILEQPTCERPLNAYDLTLSLHDAAISLFPHEKSKNAHNQALMSVRLFEDFLDAHGLTQVMPNECLLEDFRSWLQTKSKKNKNKLYSNGEAAKSVDHLRRLFNDFLHVRGITLRKLFQRKAFLKYKHFLALTKTTKDLIVAYEQDGRCIETSKKYFEDTNGREFFKYKVKRKGKTISAYNRKQRINAVRTILSTLNKAGIEQLETEDLERLLKVYHEKNRREIAKDYLAALFSVVANGIDMGMITKNPFDNFLLEKRLSKARIDFLMPEQMKKLLDLESIDWDNPADVRRRCLVMLLYDTGIRASSSVMLKLEDIFELNDGTYRLSVRGEYLKGDKEDKIFYMLFQQTIVLLRHWIHVTRPKLKPKSNHLFISLDGMTLTRTGIKNIVHDCCQKDSILTFKGYPPSPHTFRHTLPTLNTAPFGKCVAPRLMQQRLGHTNFEMFERVYVHNNPLAEMKEYKKLYLKDITGNSLSNITKEDFFQVLDSLTSAKESAIRHIKEAYAREIKIMTNDHAENKWDEVLLEDRAVVVLNKFTIRYRALRSWALKEGICRINEKNGQRQYVYDRKRILDLAENYITLKNARMSYQGSKRQFYRKIREYRKLTIGGKILILKKDFLESLIERYPNMKKNESTREKHTHLVS